MKSQRFSFSKVLMILMLFVVSTFVLVACGNADQDAMDSALETVGVTYASGDSQSSVTDNLTLPTSVGDVSVSWSSSNPDVISNAGVVTQPEADTNVTLTATLTIGDLSETFDVTVTVKAAVVVVDPVDALAAIEIDGTYEVDGVLTTTFNVTLPATSLGLDVTWASSNEAVIALDGTVSRPYFGESDQVVTLTATIGDEEQTFLVKVLAYTSKPVDQVLDEAVTALLLDGVSGGVSVDITLPETVGTAGVTVSWTSSNEAVIGTDGLVTQPSLSEGDTTVTLTATLMYQSQVRTKTFEVLVLALSVDPTHYDTIALALANAVEDDYIQFDDVTVIGMTSDTYFFTDGTAILAVYGATNVEVGKVYNIYGLYDIYYGSPQLAAGAASQGLPTVARESDGAVSAMTPTVVDDIEAYLPDTMPSYDSSNLFTYDFMTITATVRVQGDGNYDTVFVDPDYAGDDVNTESNSPYSADAIMIYYKSNKGAFDQYDGMTVTFNAVLYSLRTDRTIFTLVFLGEDDEVIFTPSDQEVADMAINSLNAMFEYEYVEAQTFDLFTSTTYGAAVAWEEVTTTGLVDLATGALTLPATGQETVTLKATVTVGTIEEVFQVTFKAGELPQSTILEAIQLGTGHLVQVTGVVTSAEYQNTYFIQDATGGIAIYTYDSDAETFLQDNYGKEITISGERAVYNGLIQLSSPFDYVIANETPTAVVALNADTHGLDATSIAPLQGQLVELTGLIVIAVDEDSYGNVYVDMIDGATAKPITMKWDSRVDLSTEAAALLDGIAEGDVLDIVNPLAWNNNPYLYFTDTTAITEGTLTDAAAVAATKAGLEVEVTEPVVADTTLDLLDAFLGTTITWSSDNTAVITDAGVITASVDMLQVDVTLTATITKGTESDTKDFVITVGDIISILNAQALDDDAELKVQGVVTAGEYYRTYFIQDSTGGIAIYTSDETMQATLEANVGKEVLVVGTRDTYNDLRQVAPTSVTALTTGTLPAALNIDTVSLNETDLLPYQGELLALTNLYVSEVSSDSYGNVYVTFQRPALGEEVEMKFDSRGTLTTEAQALLDGIAVGDVLNIEAVLSWYYGGPQFYFTSTTVVTDGTLTDADKVAVDANALSVDAAFTAATTLTLPATGAQGSSIAWASSDSALIDAATGAVVLPSSGQYLVTLTATVTLGTEEEVVTFDILVGTPVPDLFISEYIEGTPGNRKAIEIYNPTDAAITLDGVYSIMRNSGSDTTWDTSSQVLLVGTVQPGEVFVVFYDDSESEDETVQDLYFGAVGDQEGTLYFNGDDAVGLFKDGKLLDIFGNFAEDPGSGWTLGDVTDATKDHVIVRADTVDRPSPVWNTSEWVVVGAYVDGTVTTLGTHTVVAVTSYVETFANLDLEGTSYAAGSFVGDNGVTWTYSESRGDFTRDGKAIMLDKNGDGSSLSASLTGGISSFSVEYYDAYSGAAQPELWINGVLIATADAFDADGNGTFGTFTVENINITGDFTIEILAAGSQMVLDNLTWSSYS